MQKIAARLYGSISKYFYLFLLSYWRLATSDWQTARADRMIVFQFPYATSGWQAARADKMIVFQFPLATSGW
jgi:hypothetical protein